MRTEVQGIADADKMWLHDPAGRSIHLIGIGGSGMSGAAALLLGLGAKVSGSDLEPFDGLGALVAAGARVTIRHCADLLPSNVELVVMSAAIPETNPELVAARARGAEVIQYAELIGMLMERADCGIAIAGTHGKSTTTAMCAHLFRETGLDPTFLFGARSRQLGGGSGSGRGRHFIVESCEFNRSFLRLRPDYAAILNVEPDHLDCYQDIEEISEAFAQFAANVATGGLVVCNAEDALARSAASAGSARVETFGFGPEADWRAIHLDGKRGCYSFDVTLGGSHVLSTRMSIPGRHSVANALPAIALAHHAGADADSIAAAVESFAGINRRMTWRGEGRGVTIVDDYAHHPTEVRVTIEAALRRYDPKRTWVIFQPHQQERTRRLMDGFAGSFAGADEIIVPDVYGARETSETQTVRCSEQLVQRIRQCGGNARYVPDLAAVAGLVTEQLSAGDLVLTMGAGDVWKVADELVERLCEPNRA